MNLPSSIFATTNYSYNLPDANIAQTPLSQRDASKLLIRETSGEITHSTFAKLAEFAPHNALFVMNSSKVIPARVYGNRATGGLVEIVLLRKLDHLSRWSAIGRPLAKLREGEKLSLPGNCFATILSKENNETRPELRTIEVEFDIPDARIGEYLNKYGQMPLPPYVRRNSGNAVDTYKTLDQDRYQTVYAKESGSAAAPTAGLHFTQELIKQLENQGASFCDLSLHVGLGTFSPIKANDIREHVMHEEFYSISKENAQKLEQAWSDARPVILVGTTSLRGLCSLLELSQVRSCELSQLSSQIHATKLFLMPGHPSVDLIKSRINALITNFHQPQSSLFVLICALLGTDHAKRAYEIALKNQYRFLSYGDANLYWFKE